MSTHVDNETLTLFLWSLDDRLAARLRDELRWDDLFLRDLPPRDRWSDLPEGEEPAVLLAAGSADDLPWDEIGELRNAHGARLLLLLPDVDPPTWRRMTLRGFLNVLAPPFTAVDPQLEFGCRLRRSPLQQRLPDLEARLRTRVEFSFPAETRYVTPAAGIVCRLAREHAFRSDVWAERLPLALGEVLANAVEHGCGSDPAKEVTVKVWIQHDVLKIRVEDPGRGFDARAVSDPRQGASLKRGHGRGVLLMRELMDRVSFAEGGRIVTMHIQRRSD